MALINALSFTQNNSDIDVGVVKDLTDYGVGGNPARGAKANFLLWAKTDQNGTRTFFNPSQGNVYSTLQYSVQTTKDGYYEGILMRFLNYNPATPYVPEVIVDGVITQFASVFYFNGDGKIYQAIASSTGEDPDNPAFFAEVIDFNPLVINTNVDTFIAEFFPHPRANQCANRKLAADCGCGCGGDLSKIQPGLSIIAKIRAAESAFVAGNPETADKIIVDALEACTNC